ncbi:hypothetical protein AB1Y20_016753 [Prymnesium parvum]|uniref:Uncharacterized protein n=1 Tax=Prymnesium parvum TaxID=97485 RepID=A0AB34IBW0_PRYPA
MDALRAYTSSPAARLPLTPAEREELLACAVATLEHPELRAPLLSLLLHSLVALEPHDALHPFAIRLLWQLSASNSGTQVGVSGGGGAVGVLLLGFAGASLAMLKLLERTYHESLPHCRVVSAIGVGLDAPLARRRQLEEVEAALRGCGALLVHSLSNNGYFLWQNVKQALPQLVQRVRAMVFDCGPCLPGDFSANDLREVVKGAILSSAFINEIQACPRTSRTLFNRTGP